MSSEDENVDNNTENKDNIWEVLGRKTTRRIVTVLSLCSDTMAKATLTTESV